MTVPTQVLNSEQVLQRSTQSFPDAYRESSMHVCVEYPPAVPFQSFTGSSGSSFAPLAYSNSSIGSVPQSPIRSSEADLRLVGAVCVGDALFYGNRRCIVVTIRHEAQPPHAIVNLGDSGQEVAVELRHLSRVPQPSAVVSPPTMQQLSDRGYEGWREGSPGPGMRTVHYDLGN